MFTTKKDVDKHVRTGLAKLRNENEKNLRGYSIAKMYFKIGEFESTLHYVSGYLSVKDDSAPAFKLQGNCYEKLKKYEKALASYQRSLQFNPKQPDLLVDVCKLILSNEMVLTPGKIRYWCDLADAEHIQHEAALNLKMRLLRRDNADPKKMEEMLQREIVQQPNNVSLRVQMVKHMMEQDRVTEAFKYVFDLEDKHREFFSGSLDWYNSVAQVVAKLAKNDLTSNWMYWLLALKTIDRQLELTLSADKSYPQTANLTECSNLLFQFDQTLEQASKNVLKVCPERELASHFMRHYRGQLCLHAATLIFKRENLQKTHWREIMKNSLPLLLLAYNCGTTNTDEAWSRNSSEATKKMLNLWRQEGAFRCVQAGRTLLSCIENSKDNTVMANIRKICIEKGNWTSNEELIAQIRQYCSDNDWRKNVHRNLFTNTDQITKHSTSYLIQCLSLAEPIYELPRICDLENYEECAQWLYPSSLSHMVYLSMGATNISDVKCTVFNELNFSVNNLANSGAETLNQLDVDSFLYATTIQAKSKLEMERSVYESVNKAMYASKPKILPFANISGILATEEQENWWTAAYRVYRNISGDELGEVRAVLHYGIEAVRGVGRPKSDLLICLKLGQVFVVRAQDTHKNSERTFLEARAEALFKFSLYMMKMQSNRSLEQFRRFFKHTSNNSLETEREINVLAEEAVTFLASRYFKNEEYQECIDELSNIQLPFATYFQAEAYRKLEHLANTPKKNKRIYIEKAKDCLQQTLTLLEYPHVDKNHALKSIVHEDIKQVQQLLSSAFDINSSFSNGNQHWTDEQNDSIASRVRRSGSYQPQQQQQQQQQSDSEVMLLMNKMMETLNIVQDDVISMRAKLINIEEHLNKKQETQSVDPTVLDDYFIMDEELNHSAYNPAMYPNFQQQQQQQRMHTPNHMMPPQMQMNPQALNYSIYNSAYQMGINPYNVPYVAQQQHPQLPQQIRNIVPQYPDHTGLTGFVMPPQQVAPNDSRNSGLIHLLEQTAQPRSQIQQQQQPPVQPVRAAASPPVVNMSMPPNSIPFQNSNLLKTWNSSHNNAPVEKAPPVNVVITSSDPLPPHTTITSQPTLSVTIPSHHIKNNVTPVEPVATNLFGGSGGGFMKTPAPTINDSKSKVTEVAPVTKTNTIGGLTFSSAPVTTATDTTSNEAAKTKPNPFASFSFGTNTPASDKPAANIFSALTKPTGSPFGALSKPTESPFGSISSFGGLPKPNNDSPFGKTSTPQQKDKTSPISLFGSLSAPSFGKTPEIAKPVASNTDDDDEYVPTAHFEPVIALPDLVETKTGEEDEHIRFEHRAKLLRYVKETKEWKERGIGNMKVLVNKNDVNKVRLLMRREQVFKLCCNQFLSKDTKFTPLSSAGVSLTWCGQDYSENELQVELLAIRFKTADICKKFHDAILEAQKNMSESAAVKAEPISTSDPPISVPTDKKPTAIGFGDKFKPASGTWNCTDCYLSNKASDLKCMACNKPAENATKPPPVATAAVTGTSGFGNMFKPKSGSWECKACYISNKSDTMYCVACESPKDDTVPKKNAVSLLAPATTTPKFSFGVPMTTSAPIVPVTLAAVSSSTFSFGTFTAMTTTNATGGSMFGAPSSTTTPAKSTTGFTLNGGSGGFSFGNDKKAALPIASVETTAVTAPLAPKESFSFVFKPKSPGKIKTASQIVSGTEDISDDENIEEENNTYFTPAIPLPDKVDVKTGEEDEDVLYSHRAKLFRFCEGEWKERGLGDVKILKHKKSGNFRVVMRREQIFKICLNHALTTEIEYKPKDDKSWHFVANDYSEGEVELLQFCLRFKTPEIATAFKSAVDDALAGKSLVQNGNAASSTTASSVSDEDLQLSKNLQLPIDFFAYKQAVLCEGCRGCNSDDFKFPEVKDINLDIVDKNPLPLTMPFKQKSRNNDNILKQSSFSFGNNTPSKIADTPKNIFSNVSPAQGMFSQLVFGPPANSPAATIPEQSIFGNSQTSTPTSIFGGSSVAPIKKLENTDSVTAVPVCVASSFSFALDSDKTASKGFSFGSALFGSTSTTTTSSIFGTKPTESSESVLAEPIITAPTTKIETSPATGWLFGSAPPNTTPNTEQTSIFGGKAAFGKKDSPASSIFGTAFGSTPALSKFSFANQSAEEPTEEVEDGELPFKDTGISFATLATASPANVDFANLAKQSADLKGFSAISSASTSQTFIGLSKQNDFSSFKTTVDPNASGDASGGGDEASYDPHYDPIIALPDEIEVRTGEEEEQKVFGERAKLYRYDNENHEWKERGVGELKILHHPIKNTYRLLLRREQVFKCVLNHSLSTDYVIQPMKQSDRAFCWSTNNYADDSAGVLEQLSVRFKNSDIAQRFEEAVNKCVSQLKLEPQED